MELFAPQVVLTQVPATARMPRLILVEDDIIVEAPAAGAPWLTVWSLAQSRLVAALPATACHRPVEPQVAHQRHRHGRGEVVPCHEYRAVRNAVLALLARSTVDAQAAAIIASCRAADGRSLALLLNDGTLLFMGRALAPVTATVTSKTAVSVNANANTVAAAGAVTASAGDNGDLTPTPGDSGDITSATQGVRAASLNSDITGTVQRVEAVSSLSLPSPTASVSANATAMAEATDGRLSFQRRCTLALSDLLAADASMTALCLWRSFGTSSGEGLMEREPGLSI